MPASLFYLQPYQRRCYRVHKGMSLGVWEWFVTASQGSHGIVFATLLLSFYLPENQPELFSWASERVVEVEAWTDTMAQGLRDFVNQVFSSVVLSAIAACAGMTLLWAWSCRSVLVHPMWRSRYKVRALPTLCGSLYVLLAWSMFCVVKYSPF